MAEKLVSMLEEDFDPREHDDSYRESVMDVIRRKASGKEIDPLAEAEPEHGDDLAAALEASLGGRS